MTQSIHWRHLRQSGVFRLNVTLRCEKFGITLEDVFETPDDNAICKCVLSLQYSKNAKSWNWLIDEIVARNYYLMIYIRAFFVDRCPWINIQIKDTIAKMNIINGRVWKCNHVYDISRIIGVVAVSNWITFRRNCYCQVWISGLIKPFRSTLIPVRIVGGIDISLDEYTSSNDEWPPPNVSGNPTRETYL